MKKPLLKGIVRYFLWNCYFQNQKPQLLTQNALMALLLSVFMILPFTSSGQTDAQQQKIIKLKASLPVNKDDPGINSKEETNHRLNITGTSTDRCGFVQIEEFLQQKYPERPNTNQFEEMMRSAQAYVRSQVGIRDVVTIPVVIHIIHDGSAIGSGSNITDAQAISQITVLNEDFRRMNADAVNTPSDFTDVAADSEIEFCLADVDPDGNATTGITRYNGGQTVYSISDLETVIKPTTIWHPDFYFNIWVAPLGGGLLGYAQFPSMSGLPGFSPNEGPSYTDGIVVADFAFGTVGNVIAPFNLGRTATHEAGHFFGLRHIGGDGGCGVDDFCADTPTQNGQNNNGIADCSYPADDDCDDGPGDLPDQFMNYMDYSDDGCMNLFTLDQKARFDAVLAVSPRRLSLINSLTCAGQAPDYPYDPFADAPDNDFCEDAIPVECDETVSGSIVTASARDLPNACSSGPEGPGIWYSFTGDGQTYTVDMCTGTDYDSKVGIYTGTCEDLTCVAGDDDGCGGIGVPSLTSFGTVAGEIYFIYITGYNGSVGDFEFTLTCDDVPPPMGAENDLCGDAISVVCGQSIFGSTLEATTTDSPVNCGTSVGAPGVWYSFEGNGQIIVFSTCNAANYDTKINVYSGSCGALTCIAGNDDGPGCLGFTSEVAILSETGTTYFIYVNGFLGSVGDFYLTVSCISPPENDLCADAISVECGTSIDGTTVFSTDVGVPLTDCFDDPFSDDLGPGVWYQIEGTGGAITLSTCGTADYDTKLDVFIGNCGDLVCLTGNDDGPGCPGFTSELTFQSEIGQIYLIYVSGFTIDGLGTSFGDFTLNIDCACAVDPGMCYTVYPGYDPAECVEINATVNYGVAPFSYLWSTGESTSSITVCPDDETIYSVEITDAEGCTDSETFVVEVIDVSCGNKGNKVEMCKVHPNDPSKNHEVCVNSNAVPGQINSGAVLGNCDVLICGLPNGASSDSENSRTFSNPYIHNRPKENNLVKGKWDLYPNPATNNIWIDISNFADESISLRLFSSSGKVLQEYNLGNNTLKVKKINLSDYPGGIYYLQLNSAENTSAKKIVLIN